MPKLREAILLIGTLFGGITIGVIARNSFIDWTGETLVAGLLGLGGGWLAYKAAVDQRRATEGRNEYIFRANHFAELTKASERIEQLLDNDFGTSIILDPTFGLDGLIKYIDGAASFPDPLPFDLSRDLEVLCGTLPILKECKSKISGHYKNGFPVGVVVEHPEMLEIVLKTVQSCLKDIQTSALAKEISRID